MKVKNIKRLLAYGTPLLLLSGEVIAEECRTDFPKRGMEQMVYESDMEGNKIIKSTSRFSCNGAYFSLSNSYNRTQDENVNTYLGVGYNLSIFGFKGRIGAERNYYGEAEPIDNLVSDLEYKMPFDARFNFRLYRLLNFGDANNEYTTTLSRRFDIGSVSDVNFFLRPSGEMKYREEDSSEGIKKTFDLRIGLNIGEADFSVSLTNLLGNNPSRENILLKIRKNF